MDGRKPSSGKRQDGYVMVRARGTWMGEHRLVMEEILGRRLRPTETVHHRNGIRDDIRPENLELWASVQPRGARVQDLITFAREILETYENVPDVVLLPASV